MKQRLVIEFEAQYIKEHKHLKAKLLRF